MSEPFSFDVFLSHNSKDKPRVGRLAERLRKAGLRVWFDKWIIQPGDDIYLAIERGLGASRDVEMKRALARQDAGDAAVIPVIVRPCNWSRAPFARLQPLPKDAKPVTSWTNRDEAWTNVAAGIELVVARITGHPKRT